MSINEKREGILKARGWRQASKTPNCWVLWEISDDPFAYMVELTGKESFTLGVFDDPLCVNVRGWGTTDFVHMLNKAPEIRGKLKEIQGLTADCYAIE